MGLRTRDCITALAVTAALAVIIALASTDAGVAMTVRPFLFAVGFGAVLLLHRVLPRTVVVLSVLGTFAYYSLNLPPIGVALPVVAALYVAAEAGLTRFAIIAGIIVFVVSTAFRIRDDSLPLGRLLGAESISTLALLAAAITLGFAVATHRRLIDQQAKNLELSNERLTKEADLRVQNERVQISRDLHDTLGHRLAVISLHANVGSESLGSTEADNPALLAFDRIRTESSTSLADLRSMVKVLRTDSGEATSATSTLSTQTALGIDGIDTLCDQVRAAGITVDTHLDDIPDILPTPVESAVFRIVQESLTNILKHARASTVQVEVRLGESDILVTVADDGIGTDSHTDSGFGLKGMVERIRLLGGNLHTHSAPGKGFSVEARVPRRLPQ